jgi:hypothetical protein
MDVSPGPASVRFSISCIQLKDSLTILSSFAADYDSTQAINDSFEEIKFPVSRVLTFAKQKLLYSSFTKMSSAGILACLSVRFALDFDLSARSRSQEDNQVEEHLRLCLRAISGFGYILTTAVSEPFLAKAAAQLIPSYYHTATPAEDLVTHGLDCIDYGQQGSLTASLLIMQARDMARGKEWERDREWVYVLEFMTALLPPDEYNTFISTPPAIYLPHTQKAALETTFNDSKIWFNHVIKVDRDDKIHVSHLWKFVSRGAMIICPLEYHGIDIVLPVCFKGDTLARDNMTAILIQVKNDKRYRKDVSGNLFDHMDPFDIGLFSNGDVPLPVIRMVFALGSDECGITFPSQEKCGLGGRFTSYDVWCAGLSPSTFGCIGKDLSSYRAVLERSIQA